MPRPSDLPPPERFNHGSRSRYVSGCRCTPCRAANTRAYHERQARAKAFAAEIDVDAGPVEQLWTAPDGTKKLRTYRRACPGPGGGIYCPRNAHLRRDSKGGVCATCRELLVWNGNVWAGEVRAHLRRLSRAGVGYKAVADACDVSKSSLQAVLSGKKKLLRRRTVERILAVTADAIADHGFVDARATWKLIDEMRERAGLTKREIARRLGYQRYALQIRRDRIIAVNALKVKRLHERVMRQVEVDERAELYRRIEAGEVAA